MRIIVNDREMFFEKTLFVRELIIKLDLEIKNIAIEINKTIIPRSQYDIYCIKENDQIEIINAVGGG